MKQVTKLYLIRGLCGPFRIDSWYKYARKEQRSKIVFEANVDKFNWYSYAFKMSNGYYILQD